MTVVGGNGKADVAATRPLAHAAQSEVTCLGKKGAVRVEGRSVIGDAQTEAVRKGVCDQRDAGGVSVLDGVRQD